MIDTTKLTVAQWRMHLLLELEGPFTEQRMKSQFGRNWKRVWSVLEEVGLVEFCPDAINHRRYRAKPLGTES